MAERPAPSRFERVADGANAVGFRDAQQGARDLREHVGVFVAVDVGDGYAGVLQLANLGRRLAFYVEFADAAKEEIANEAEELRSK